MNGVDEGYFILFYVSQTIFALRKIRKEGNKIENKSVYTIYFDVCMQNLVKGLFSFYFVGVWSTYYFISILMRFGEISYTFRSYCYLHCQLHYQRLL